jgi:hypothetical protein
MPAIPPGKSPWLWTLTWSAGTPWVDVGAPDKPLSQAEVDVIRPLAERVAEIAALPVQQEKIKMWKDLNSLKPQRAMVMIDELPWHELRAKEDSLRLQTEDEFARSLEQVLRQTIYAWENWPVDMVVEPYVDISKVVKHDGFGIDIIEETIQQGDEGTVSSHHYSDRIPDEKALEQLRPPTIELDAEKTEIVHNKALQALDGILEIRMQGLLPWFALWDDIEELRGTEQILYDLIDRPDFLHAIASRMTDVRLAELDTLEEKGLLGYDLNRVHCTGGHTDELPGYHSPREGFDPEKATAKDNWIWGMAQLYVSTSDEMWAEMDVPYITKYYSRFGMGYYGCCDPLDTRIDWIRQMGNVRKISMSPWAKVQNGAKNIGTDFVFSRKPNPAIMAMDTFVPELAVKDFEEVLAATNEHGCPTEFTLKDITTIRSEPQRLKEWAEIAKP